MPPYIKREATAKDKKDYQTVYAENRGSVAAPTAGLHLTKGLINKFDKKGDIAKKGKANELILNQALDIFYNNTNQISSSFDINDFRNQLNQIR